MTMNDGGDSVNFLQKPWVTRIVGILAALSTIGVGILSYLETETNAELNDLVEQVQTLQACVDTGDIERLVAQIIGPSSQGKPCPGEGMALGELNQQVAFHKQCMGLRIAEVSTPIEASTSETDCGKLNSSVITIEPERRELAQQRKDAILKEYVPKLIRDEKEFREALAVISVMFPNETKDILLRVIKTLDKDKQPILYDQLTNALVKAENLDTDTGPWIIVLLQNRSRDKVEDLANDAKESDLPLVEIYRFPGNAQEVFAASFGIFKTEMNAQIALAGLEPTLGRHAFVADRGQWCADYRRILEESVDQGVFVCSTEVSWSERLLVSK